jgi:hypothetical protein
MRLYARRLSFAVLLVTILSASSLDAQTRGCGWRCSNEYSGTVAECVTVRFLGQDNCRVVANCQVVIVDPDGPFGPAAPGLAWNCTYDCVFDTCIWV